MKLIERFASNSSILDDEVASQSVKLERDEKLRELVTESFNLFPYSKRDTHLEYHF